MPIHTADDNATKMFCHVAGMNTIATSSRRLPTDTVENLETDQKETPLLFHYVNFDNNDDIITSLLKKLSICIKIGVTKRYGVCLVSFKCRQNPSAVVVS